MRARFVTTRPDGAVTITIPSARCVGWMQTGGYWADRPRGFLDVQIERQIADGRQPEASRRFARALMFGGISETEALQVLAARDCAHLGTGLELWDQDDVPSDRWFRDAWRRSHNGGPIRIDLEAARHVQWRRLRAGVSEARQALDLYQLFPRIDWDEVRARITRAATPEELRTIWPL